VDYLQLKVLTMSVLIALALAPAVLAQTGRQTFFPPNLNSTSYITDANGTYGGIYQADTFNGTSYDPAYGTYDVCISYPNLPTLPAQLYGPYAPC